MCACEDHGQEEQLILERKAGNLGIVRENISLQYIEYKEKMTVGSSSLQ